MATLFNGSLDIGYVALRPGSGANGRGIVGKSVREIGQNAARIEGGRPNRGNSPQTPNRWTLPPINVN